jgi:hypothetical protein
VPWYLPVSGNLALPQRSHPGHSFGEKSGTDAGLFFAASENGNYQR